MAGHPTIARLREALRVCGLIGLATFALVAGLLAGCARSAMPPNRPQPQSNAGTSTLTVEFVVRNSGFGQLPPMRLKQDGGAYDDIRALSPGASQNVRFSLDRTKRDVILADLRSGQELGVFGPVPSGRVYDHLLDVKLLSGKLTGWVSPVDFPRDVPGGAGYPMYDLAAARQQKASEASSR